MTGNYDAIIIGAGLSGAVIARTLANANKKVLIIERKGEIAGNMFDYKNEHNIVIHQYGPHILLMANALQHLLILRLLMIFLTQIKLKKLKLH